MKKLALVIALMAVTSAYATDMVYMHHRPHMSWGEANSQSLSSAQSSANSTSTGGSVGNINNGANGGNASVDNDTRMPASSAISPSVGTSNDCQIATPSSKAFSVLIFSASGTTGVNYNDLCFAYKMKQFDIAEKLMCAKSQDYAKFNPNCATK